METLNDRVLVPVTAEEVPAVMDLLQKLRGTASVVADEDVGEPAQFVDIRGQRRWYRHEPDLLKDQLPYALLKKLLDLVASAKGDWVAKHEAENPEDPHSKIQLRNELGAFTKACKRIFGTKAWPMEWKKERGTFYYRMEPKMAEWWKNENGGK